MREKMTIAILFALLTGTFAGLVFYFRESIDPCIAAPVLSHVLGPSACP